MQKPRENKPGAFSWRKSQTRLTRSLPQQLFLTEAIAFQFSSATLSAISHSPDGFFFGNFLRVMVLPEAEM